MIPFSVAQFLDSFRQYNVAVWPVQVILNALALAAIGLTLLRTRDFSCIVAGILSLLWLWTGLVYHFLFFARINKAAYLFAAIFVVQSILLAYMGIIKRRLSFGINQSASGIVGGLFLVYALAIYPVVSDWLGHKYPLTPTFGVPCPTTIFTFGIILWTRGKPPLSLMIIPFIWSLVGFSAAVSLKMSEDFGLVVSGVLGFTLLILRRH